MEVTLIMAATLDGMIARHSSHMADWTGKEDKKYFAQATRAAGVVIMGFKTYDTIGHPLSGRLNVVMTRNKDRVSNEDNLIYTDQSPATILKCLEGKGYSRAAVIGGAMINSLFIQKNLIAEIHLVLAPKLFGTGITLFRTELDLDLELKEYRELDKDHLLIIYIVKKGNF